MRRLIAIIASLVVATSGAATVAPAVEDAAIAGQYVVYWPDGRVGDIPAIDGVTVLETPDELAALGVSVVSVDGLPALAALRRSGARADRRDSLEAGPGVNTPYSAISAPLAAIDPLLADQWHHARVDSAGAWRAGFTGVGVRVAVVDTGIAPHADLSILAGKDFTGSGTWVDQNGHGTHVAGIIGARYANGRGGSGIAPGVDLLAARALGADGIGYNDWIAAGIVWSVNNGARVVNLSLGSPDPSVVLERALAYAVAHGAIPVCAAGNDGSSRLDYPSAYPDCLSVAASNLRDEMAPWSNHARTVDITAPGVGILSTCYGLRGEYCYMDGTSMAAPVVSGVAALVAQSVRNPAGVSWRIRSRADIRPALPGGRRVNAARAVAR